MCVEFFSGRAVSGSRDEGLGVCMCNKHVRLSIISRMLIVCFCCMTTGTRSQMGCVETYIGLSGYCFRKSAVFVIRFV